MDLPTTPRKALNVTHTLDKELERETSLSPKKREKRNQAPSLVSSVKIIHSSKLDLGVKMRPKGRKTTNQVREDETKRSLVDGSQKNLLECSLSVK